jgi:hypothetical protein
MNIEDVMLAASAYCISGPKTRASLYSELRAAIEAYGAACAQAAQAPLIAEIERLRAGPAELSDERIDYIADVVVKGMPEGIQGFCKSWGWRHFARAILSDCRGHVAAPKDTTP